MILRCAVSTDRVCRLYYIIDGGGSNTTNLFIGHYRTLSLDICKNALDLDVY